MRPQDAGVTAPPQHGVLEGDFVTGGDCWTGRREHETDTAMMGGGRGGGGQACVPPACGLDWRFCTWKRRTHATNIWK